MSYKFLTIPAKSLYQSILSTSTSFKMSDIKGFDGNDLTSSDFGTVGYGVFLSSDKQLMELFSFDPTTIASTSINFINRGLPFDGGAVSITSNKLDWSSGSTQVLIGTDSPQVLQWLKDYIDAAVINAGVPATDVVPGISIEATTAEIDADTEERTYSGLQYKLFINPAKLILSKFGLRLPTADQKAALVGSQGVPNATNTYITKDNVYDSETDQTQTTQNSTVEFGEANTTGKKNIITQSFTPSKTKIKGVKLYKSANTGTFTGNITVALFADSAGSPTGSALATVTITNVVYNALAVGEFEAIFSSEYSMTAGNLYWFKVSASTADNSNHPNLGVNTAGGYASGSVKYYNGTDGYVAIANIDLYFKTLQGTQSQAIQSDTTGKLPATFYDLTKMPIPTFYQELVCSGIDSIELNERIAFGSNNDGSVFYVAVYNTALYRFERDSKTGLYIQTHRIAPTFFVDSGDWGSIIQIGGYIYCFSSNGTNIRCSRFLASDLTGEQVMTVPTVACTTDVIAWTDGQYAYVVSAQSGTTSNKWSLSGTTFSAVSTASVTGIANSSTSMFYDGSYAYLVYANTPTCTIKKFTNIDGSTTTTTIKTIPPIQSDTFNSGLGVNVDSNRMYVGYLFKNYNETNADAQKSLNIRLYPVSKP